MRTLHRGDKGDQVRLLQTRLTVRGFHVAIDGDFGPKTEAVVIQFQAAHGLLADGYVGPQTWDLLLSTGRVVTPQDSEHLAGLLDTANDALAREANAADVERRLAVLQRALDFVGIYEEPPGSNEGAGLLPLLRDSNRRTYWQVWKVKGAKPPPWCALFVFGALYGAYPNWALTPPKKWLGAVAWWEDWARTVPAAVRENGGVPFYTLPADDYAGAVFSMARQGSSSDPSEALRSGHMGLVICRDGMEFLTVEGNVNDGVEVRRRKFGEIRLLFKWWLAEVAGE